MSSSEWVPSVEVLRDMGPLTLREVTAETARRMGVPQTYEDVAAVLERERKRGRVARVSEGGDYRNNMWDAAGA